MKKHATQSRHIRNNLLIEKLQYTGNYKEESRIELVQYNTRESKTSVVAVTEDPFARCEPDTINWIRVTGMDTPEVIGSLGEKLGLHRMDIQDILSSRHVAKVEEYDDKVAVQFNTVFYTEQAEIITDHITIVLSKEYVVTFQESSQPLFNNIDAAIVANTSRIKTRSIDYLFCLLINNVLNNYVSVLEQMETELEQMEDDILRDESHDFGGRIQAYRRNYMLIKRLITPFKEELTRLIHNQTLLVTKSNVVYLNDLGDRVRYVVQSIELCRETLSSLRDLYVSNNDNRRNEIMKRLTVISTIFIPLTFLAGVWGMNFRYMPELNHPYGYLMAWSVFGITATLLFLFLKRRRWF